MAHDEHHTPGEPPPVRDEAADSPLWLPAVGLTLLVLGAILLVWRATDDGGPAFDVHEEEPTAEEAAEEEAAAEPEGGGEGAAPSAAPAAPAEAPGHEGHGH